MNIKLVGTSSEKEFRKNLEVCMASGILSRSSGTVFDVFDRVSQKSTDEVIGMIERVIGMGHTSIVDSDFFVFAISGVSPVVEQTLIESRFSTFTIKSRREVDFSTVGRVIPTFKDDNLNVLNDQELLKNNYKIVQDFLFATYQDFLTSGVKKEDARYILPYSFHSEMIMGMNATELEKVINMLINSEKSHIDELKAVGEKLYEISLVRAPYLSTLYNKRSEQKTSPIKKVLSELEIDNKTTILDKTKLVNFTNDIDKTIFVNCLMRVYQLPFNDAINYYDTKIKDNDSLKTNLIKAINQDVYKEDLKSVYFRFQSPISLANLTHLTRHRTIDLSIPSFDECINKEIIKIPPVIESNVILKDKMRYANEINYKAYNIFRKNGIREEDLVYFNLSGHQVNAGFGLDGLTLKHVSALRECNKAQWEVRNIVSDMDKLVTEHSDYYSKIIGPNCAVTGNCPEGTETCGRLYTKKI